MDEPRTEELAALATRAIDNQVHPANWSYWVRLVMMGGPARDFIEAASPTVVLDLIEQVRAASRPAVGDGLREVREYVESLHDDPIRFGSAKDASQNTARAVLQFIDAALADKGSPEDSDD